MTQRSRGGLGCVLTGLLGFVVLAIVAVVAVVAWVSRDRTVLPPAPHCIASTGDHTVRISPDQAWWTSIIVGTSIKRGLPARAASIAMATVYQETGIRNLDHGDRDSVGLFQQRPSQGWGTVEQIMDPYYSTGRFYDALVKIDDWQHSDITEIAQAVQRSGHPEAYRKHEANARTLASTLTGWTPAGFSCVNPETPGDADGLDDFLVTTLGIDPATRAEDGLHYTVSSGELAWAVAHIAVATGSRFGTVEVRVADRRWQHDRAALAPWTTAEAALGSHQVVVRVAPASP